MLGFSRKFFRSCACCDAPSLSRRQFVVTGAAALAVGSAVPAAAQAPANPQRIDVHHHFSPPKWIAEVKGRELLQPANTNWTPAKSIEDMDKGGVAAAMISITNPGLWFGDKEVTRRIAHECNEYGAKLVQQHPTRFG